MKKQLRYNVANANKRKPIISDNNILTVKISDYETVTSHCV